VSLVYSAYVIRVVRREDREREISLKNRPALGGNPMKQPSARPIHEPGSESGAGDHDLDALLGRAFEERPIWAALYENVRDTFFAPALPPLELTSTPIQAPDRMATRTSPWAVGTSALVNGAILTLLILLGLRSMNPTAGPHSGSPIDLDGLNLLAPLTGETHGGGSGGAHDLIDPSRGAPPKVELAPIVPPQIPLIEQPKLAVDPAIAAQIKLPENTAMASLGVSASANVRLAANGPGGPAGIGSNAGSGDGSGRGPGLGPGADGNWGGNIYSPGIGGVTAPIPIVTPEAEFSDEARRAKYQGVCVISLIVDAQGYPRNPRVVQSLGMGLDEKALEAVLKYRFKPAMRAGRPVPVMISVEVNFRLY
jgi:periplasmic protein TonB